MARSAAAPDETLALRIETTADVGGIRQVRQENTALARDARAAAQQMTQDAQRVSGAQETVAGSARRVSEEQDRITVSTEAMRQIVARSGGDLSRMRTLLAEYAAGIQQGTRATDTQTESDRRAQEQLQRRGMMMIRLHEEAIRTEAARERAIRQAAQASADAARRAQEDAEARARALQREGMAMARMHEEALRMNQAYDQKSQAIERLSPKVQTGTNALTAMAFAIADGNTGARGLAIAAGTAANAVAMLSTSARLAAGAAGIGALVTILASVVILLDRIGEKTSVLERVGRIGDFSDEAFEARQREMDQKVQRQQADAAAAAVRAREHPLWDPAGSAMASIEARREQKALEELLAQQASLREEASRRVRDRERRAAEESKELRQQAAADADRMNQQMTESAMQAIDRATLSEAEAAERRVQRERERRLAEIEDERFTAEEKKNLRVAAEADAAAQIQLIRKEGTDREKSEAKKNQEEIERAQKQALQRRISIIESAISASIAAGESLGRMLTRMALTPIIKELEGIAASQLAKAGVAAWTGNLIGAARHATAAGLAAAAARKVAQQGGMAGGGGEGGGFGGGGPQMFSRDPGERNGNVTVVIQTVNPFSKEVLGETSYQLNRAGVLKTPLYAPATIGAQVG